MSKATFQALGTGDGWASDRRGHSAFLFTLKDSILLLDCGEPVSRQLRAVGVQPDDLDGIVLSHLHCDHSHGSKNWRRLMHVLVRGTLRWWRCAVRWGASWPRWRSPPCNRDS